MRPGCKISHSITYGPFPSASVLTARCHCRYPTLAIFYPEVARNLLQYRFNRLSEAKANAVLNGFKVQGAHVMPKVYVLSRLA